MNKFIGTIQTTLPSGEQKDYCYYSRMLEIYAKWAKETTLPCSFDSYMDAYKFLKSNLKFEAKLVGKDSEEGNVGAAPSAKKRKINKSLLAFLGKNRPLGRNKATARNRDDFFISKVEDQITTQLKQGNSNISMYDWSQMQFEDLQAGIQKANDNMFRIAELQLMNMASSPLKKKYIANLFQTSAAVAENKMAEEEIKQHELQNQKARLQVEAL